LMKVFEEVPHRLSNILFPALVKELLPTAPPSTELRVDFLARFEKDKAHGVGIEKGKQVKLEEGRQIGIEEGLLKFTQEMLVSLEGKLGYMPEGIGK